MLSALDYAALWDRALRYDEFVRRSTEHFVIVLDED